MLDALIVTLKTTHPQLYKYLHENTDIVIYVHFDNIPSTRPNTIFKGHSSVTFNDGRFPIDYKFVKLRNSEVIKGKKEIASFYSSGDSRKYEGTAPPIMGKHIINNLIAQIYNTNDSAEMFSVPRQSKR